jgi:hypothetical protein
MEKMIYIFFINLTLFAIGYILYKRRSRVLNKIMYTQSNMHEIIKNFIPSDFFDKPKKLSQAQQHIEKNTMSVVFIEEKAYWVSNNVFYTADIVDGSVDSETTQPVNTDNMTKNDINKMLFILDNLKNGNNNDSGSARNERF